MNRSINKIAILGSGVMGSQIACHFANIGVRVLLLDIVPREPNEAETKAGLTLESPKVRNRIVNDALAAAIKMNPAPLYRKSFASRIETGNFDDDMAKIAECDWVMEVVVERLDIKQQVFEKVEKYRKPGSLISTNTSGIPIGMLTEGRSEDFVKHFSGTHFFNPPRYLRLLEIIPSPGTDPAVVDFYMDYGARFLGKTTVLCKDTPAFIANRVGVYSIQQLFHTVSEMGLTVEEVDKLTGPAMGRPKSATFRTCDVVGLDTLVHVANGVKQNCPNDERNDVFAIPPYVQKMVENNWLGSKSGQGFYKKVKGEGGKSEILVLDLKTLEYRSQEKVKFATLEAAKLVDALPERTALLYNGTDRAGEFFRKSFQALFAYVSHRVPEISDELFKIDEAMKAGFGWEIGAFESWDAIGFAKVLSDMEANGHQPAQWIRDMSAQGKASFYRTENGIRKYYDHASGEYRPIPGQEKLVILSNIPAEKIVWKNSGTTIKDLGDGILNIEFHTKMNTIGGDVIAGLNKAIDMAEKEYRGLVISNEGQNFSAGANVGMIFMLAAEQEWDELNFAIAAFQKTVTRMRFSSVPVVAAPHGLTLGGSCELSMHCDKVVAHAETYMGLVEFGVGVIPGGGGTKEFALRLSDEMMREGDIRIPRFRERFLTIGQAKVATSAYEAFDLGYLRIGVDEVVVSRAHQLARAKRACLELADKGYTQPHMRKDITVLGREGLGIVYVGAHSMMSGNYISSHDQLISEKLGYVLCGGDLSQPTQVSEQYLLDLERKTFLELCMQRKTLERMQSLVAKGKILRN
jgi:3-hydroxyacyl-CoA dehydrogenase